MIELHSFDTPAQQAAALAQAVASTLEAALAQQARRPLLAVSGGTSPKAFFAALAQQPLDWAGLDVTLVDDRWVPESDSASNAALVRNTLLQQGAAVSRFLPLVDTAVPPQQHIDALNADAARRLPDVAVLGMGEDGHTASLFAASPEWAQASTTQAHFALTHPSDAPHARVTWSLRALQRVPKLFLLISGARKLAVLQQAVAGLSSQPVVTVENAISKLACHEGVHLDVYWCAE